MSVHRKQGQVHRPTKPKYSLLLCLYFCVSCHFLYLHWILYYFFSTISHYPLRKPMLSVKCISVHMQCCLKIILPFFLQWSWTIFWGMCYSNIDSPILVKIDLFWRSHWLCRKIKHFLLLWSSISLYPWKSLIVSVVFLNSPSRNRLFHSSYMYVHSRFTTHDQLWSYWIAPPGLQHLRNPKPNKKSLILMLIFC